MGKLKNLWNRIRSPTGKTLVSVQMMDTYGNGFYAWNGKLYKSDVVRSCVRPKAKAIGKMVLHHVRETADGKQMDPDTYMRFLLSDPNPIMSMQKLLEKMINTKAVNNNAFALIIRDENGYPTAIYPIPAIHAEAILDKEGTLFLRFTYRNGGEGTFPYSDIIHLRGDYEEDDIFGTPPSAALAQLMDVVNASDVAVVNAVKRSGVIRWLMKITTPLRDEDVKRKAKEFAENFLSIEEGGYGVAATDNKADIQPITQQDYVPNAAVTDKAVKRIQGFFNTNDRIVHSEFTENDWIAYYEAEVEPDVIEICQEFSRKLFSRLQRARGNSITCEASTLQYASMATKMNLIQFVDRGIMTPNEVRVLFALAPVAGGDVMVRRLDTVPTTESAESGEGGNEDEGQSNG